MTKLLFILKRREITYEENNILYSQTPNSPYFKYCMSSGLRNSSQFVVSMLQEHGIEAKLVEVVDNNCIDREVYEYKPTHVIIEAFWVVPEKFHELHKLHPKVKWIIRNHSELPFLANEGQAIHWSLQYLKYKNVFLAPNSKRAYEDTKKMVAASISPLASEYRVLYLPNYYQIKGSVKKLSPVRDTVNVGCFGAVRPLKNHLIQAVAAIDFARSENKKLRFHINVSRIEDSGNNSLKSLRGLFANLDSERFELVEHNWLNHEDFLKLVRTMDIGLQTSFSETFNIVAADFVSQGIPIVVSKEISWIPEEFHCRHTDSKDIVRVMKRTLFGFRFWWKAYWSLNALKRYNRESKHIWIRTFSYL